MVARVPNIGRTISNIRRAREILTVFVGYGFGEAIQELGLDRLLHKGKRLLKLTKVDESVQREPQAVRLRKAMESLGPTFVKMAQVLSTRPDLIPEDWAKEFGRLQSSVEPAPADKMRAHIEQLYHEPWEERFSHLDFEPVAAASVAQAHHAVLRDGTPVLLKILRPGVRERIETDLEILKGVAAFAEEHFSDLGYSPVEVVQQFENQIRRETDLLLELRSVNRMKDAFADDERVHIPGTYPEHSRRQVLCLERIEGELLSDSDDETFTDAERREIVSIGSDAVFRQCFELGFFHADPHPGNLIVIRNRSLEKRDPGGGRKAERPPVQLCFIDFGMVGHIDPHTAERLADLVHGTINGELDRVVEVVVDFTNLPPREADGRAFRADVWEFISRFQTSSLSTLQMGQLLDEFFTKLKRNRLRCPADLVYLIKAITTIEGVGEKLDPEFDIVQHVRPHVERLLHRRYGFAALKRRLQGMFIGYSDLLERTPRAIRDLLQLVRQEQFTVNLEHQGLQQLTDEIERASRNISSALVIASLLVGGSILFLADTVSDDATNLLFYGGVVAIAAALLLAVARVLLPRW